MWSLKDTLPHLLRFFYLAQKHFCLYQNNQGGGELPRRDKGWAHLHHEQLGRLKIHSKLQR
jgi:hypothetical protein